MLPDGRPEKVDFGRKLRSNYLGYFKGFCRKRLMVFVNKGDLAEEGSFVYCGLNKIDSKFEHIVKLATNSYTNSSFK